MLAHMAPQNPSLNILPPAFFERPVLKVAPELLGKYLVRKLPNGVIDARMIVEVEAYDGEKDKASHASRGRTLRTEVLYGEAGNWYVYLCYGIHFMLNVVTGQKGYPSAVLVRGVEGAIGPGRVTKALAIDKSLNTTAAAPISGLWIEDRGVIVRKSQILKTPRIGVDYAGEWAKKPYRFVLAPNLDE